MHKNIYRLDQLIDAQSVKSPDKVAIKHGSRTFTYKTVNEIANQLAHYFIERNIKPGDMVGVAVERSASLPITLLALIKVGATYLPIDYNFPIERINYMLKDAGATVLVTSENFRDKYRPETEVITLEEIRGIYEKYPVENLEIEIPADSLAYILYTSGSTGNPKGVQVKHSSLLNLLLSVQQEPGMNSDDIILATTTISFDIAELEVFLPLISGATMIIAEAQAAKDGRSLLELAKAEQVTIMQGTPFMWRMMLEAGWDEPLSIKVFCGGEAMAKDLARKLLGKCNSLWNMYGPTETTIYSIIKQVTLNDEIITIGKPILNTQVYILDEHQKEVPNGEVGEICIAGAGVALGYINKPDLTEEKFIDNTFSTIAGEKMYKTGDLGKWLENGEIHCLGRIDHQIKIRGYRIETEEIEFKLKNLDHIKEAIVVLFKDALENMHLVAYIVSDYNADATRNAERIKGWKEELKKVIPEYMMPDNYMVIPAIPLMANGKVDRKSLPDPILREPGLHEFKSPNTEMEVLLTKICLQNIALSEISINDNFFELGIDSLIAVKIMVQIEKQLGKRIPLSILIGCPTIKQLATYLENDKPDSPYKSLAAIKPEGTKPPLYIVHGIGLNILNLYSMVSNLDPDQPVYGLQAVGLDGTVEPLDNMEAIAEFYIREIIKHNPSGPYAIAGYSFGGVIAFEMARQLKKMGKEVCFLGMFDTNIQYPTHQYPTAKKIAVKVSRQVHKLFFRTNTLLTHPVLTMEYLKAYYTQKLNLPVSKKGLLEVYDSNELPDFMQEIVKRLYAAFYNYKIKPLDVKIDLFRAGTRMYYVDDPKYLGWGKYATKGVSVFNVPGDHKEMFSAPNDKVLAEVLQQRLNKIQLL
ncbi:non-ribosomal peptide synthetase [Pedobacter sp. L105]|uniref:non-ribosomal peptide synthetase n=1 Tax=Pedobacter sp. L105 TaxID=1641871 RepID=UPI00131CE0B1|nr:non-ribosomal peptide synthetase [Pedobacter sp. L105]